MVADLPKRIKQNPAVSVHKRTASVNHSDGLSTNPILWDKQSILDGFFLIVWVIYVLYGSTCGPVDASAFALSKRP